jgi:hypothetical protein
MAPGKGQGRGTTLGKPDAKPAKLPYTIELWDIDRKEIERLLARAASASLARAIFTAAREEHPERRITMSRGARVIAQSD